MSSGDKGDPRTGVWWKGAICEFTLRNPCLIWNSQFILLLGYNWNCFHRGVPNFISANSLEIRLFEFDGPTQSLLQLQGRKVQNICPLFLIFILFVFLTFRLNSHMQSLVFSYLLSMRLLILLKSNSQRGTTKTREICKIPQKSAKALTNILCPASSYCLVNLWKIFRRKDCWDVVPRIWRCLKVWRGILGAPVCTQ